jgi:hypothetical protein
MGQMNYQIESNTSTGKFAFLPLYITNQKKQKSPKYNTNFALQVFDQKNSKGIWQILSLEPDNK